MVKYIYFVLVIWNLIYKIDNSLIRIEDGGYSGIVVGFSRKINTGQKELLQNLMDLFNEASVVLHEITKAYFKEITFLIPQSWGEKENWFNSIEKSSIKKTQLERYNEADVFLESENDFFQNSPYTIQTAGCGKQGLGIHISKTYLQSNKEELHLKARNLVYEWMKYRYGVFDEHGFQGDERYPVLYGIPGNSTFIKVTSCSNHPVDYTEKGGRCSITETSGRLTDSTCDIEIKLEETNESSSFMFSPIMTKLCGKLEYSHDRSSPTKHNALCLESSSSEIISRHKDFKSASTPSVDLAPNFRYVQESNLRLLLAIDNSKDNSEKEVNRMLKKIVNQFLNFYIVKEQHVDLLFYDSQNKTNLKPFEDNWSYPRPRDAGPGCITCALRDSMKVLEKYEPIEGSILVLIVKHPLSDAEVKILRDDFESKSIRVHVILCLLDGPPEVQLESLVANTRARIQYVPLDAENAEHFLYAALQSSVRDYTFGTAEDNIMIMQKSFKDSKSFVDITFPVDRRTKREVKILLSPAVILEEYTLSVNNNDMEGGLKFSELSSAELQVLELLPEIDPVGDIKLSVRKENVPVDVAVVAKETTVSSAIIIRCWLSTDSQFVKVDSEPVILYTEVRSGSYPVQNARVEATLHHPDKVVTNYILADDGIGDPDITKDDGIYSHYITGFSTEGHYLLTVLVTNDDDKTKIITATGRDSRCCGSFFPSKNAVDTGKFRRVYNYGSLYISFPQNAEEKDFYPPSRITDFKVVDVRDHVEGARESEWRFYVDFEFSAPGGNYNNDKASKYDIRYSSDRSLITNFDAGKIPDHYQYHPQIISIKGYGEKESLTLEMPVDKLKELKSISNMVFFAIRAIDGNEKGEPSNVVQVYLPIPSPPTKSPVPSSTPALGGDGGVAGEEDRQTDGSQKKMTSRQIGMIIGIVIGCIILLIAVAVGAFLFTRRKNTRKPKANRALPENNEFKKVSNEYLSGDGMNAPVSISDPINPIQSWPANVLMDHYDKMQESKGKNGSNDSMDSSSADSSHPLKLNPIYEDGTGDRYPENNSYLPTAPYSSSQSSLNKTPRNVTQV